jgi:hypothetical protein
MGTGDLQHHLTARLQMYCASRAELGSLAAIFKWILRQQSQSIPIRQAAPLPGKKIQQSGQSFSAEKP